MIPYSFRTVFLLLWALLWTVVPSQSGRCDEGDDGGPAPAFTEIDAAEARPLLLIGGKYGKYDRDAIRDEILIPRKLTYEDGGEWSSAENWKSYSLVIIAHTLPESLSDQEHGWIRDYLTNGGRLVLTGAAIGAVRQRSNAPLDWLGAGGYQAYKSGDFSVTETGAKYTADFKAVAALLQGVNVTGPNKVSTAQPLIKRGANTIAFRNSFGKGEVIYLGFDYFRLAGEVKDKAKKIAARLPVRQLLEKIIITGDTQTKADAIARGLREYGVAQPVVWRRDFAGARGGEYASPPYPKPGEALKRLQLDVGMNEWESIPIYLSSPLAAPGFEVHIDNFQAREGGGQNILPASSLRLRMQGLARPNLTVGPFWLLDLPHSDTATGASWRVPLEAAHSQTLWLTLNTTGLVPGQYRTSLQFKNPVLPPVELEVKVWPVHLPGREFFEAEATFLWNGISAGGAGGSYKFPDPPTNLDRYEKHIRNLTEHHITFNMDSSWSNRFGRSISLKNVRLRDGGTPFEDALKQGLVKTEALPELDFSYFDPFIETGLLRGMPYFHFNFKNLPQDWLSYAREITRNPKLPADSPEHTAIKKWLLTQCVQYLRSKGIRKIVAFVADEIAPEKIADATRRAALLKECGMRVEFTATGETGQSREHIAAMNPVIDRWIWNIGVLPQAKSLVRSTNSPIGSTDEEYTYVADWHRAPYVFNRARGPFCAWNDLDGIFIHGYLRWYPNGGGVFNGSDGPIDTEGWEGARDGIEDARYWRRLAFLLAATRQRPELAAGVQTIEERLAHWVSQNPNAYVLLQERAYHIYRYLSPASSYEALLKLKAELLESLAWLEQKVPTNKALHYDGNIIVQEAEIVVDIEGSAAAKSTLEKALATRCEKSLVAKPQGKTRVLLISSEEAQRAVPALAKSLGQPRAGHFKIGASDGLILVCGGDSAGIERGARALAVLCEQKETVP